MARKPRRPKIKIKQPQLPVTKPRSLNFLTLGQLGFPGVRFRVDVTPFFYGISIGWTTCGWVPESFVVQVGPVALVLYVAGSDPVVRAPGFTRKIS